VFKGRIVEIIKGKKYKVIIEAGKDPATGDRKRITKNVNGRKTLAESIMIDIISELKQGTYTEPNKITFGNWLITWLNDYKKLDLRQSTWESYEIQARLHIIPALGALYLQDLRPEHLQKLYSDKLKAGKSSRTVRYIHQVAHGALEQAVKNKLISGQNAAKMTTLPPLDQKEIRAMSPEEQDTFLESIKKHSLSAALLTLIGTGMRRGELLGLRWQDVDLDKGIIQIKQNLVGTKQGLKVHDPKTKSSKRSFSVPQLVLEILNGHKLKMQAKGFYDADNYVFCSNKGNAMIPRNFNRSFTNFINSIGLVGVTVHTLRHTFATRMLEIGVPMRVVQEMLGHAKITVTAGTYSHVSPDLKRDAADKMNDVLKGTEE